MQSGVVAMLADPAQQLAWAVTTALSAPDPAERRRAEDAIKSCALQPGYCCLLLQLTAAPELGDTARLLAATQLKNEVLRRWCGGPRGIPEAERPVLRAALLARLASAEPCEQVGLQVGITIARIMRSEANRGLSTVLQAFIDAMLQQQLLPPHALLALLYTAKELGSMRLPAQKRLAARVAALLLPSLCQQWSVALHAAMQPGAEEGSVAALTLLTKVVRQLFERLAAGGEAAAADDDDEERQRRQRRAESAALVLAAVPLVQQRCAAAGGGATWARLGSALGKLLVALARQDAQATAAAADDDGGGGGGGEGIAAGVASSAGGALEGGGFPWGQAVEVCWAQLVEEAACRTRLLGAAGGGGGGGGGGSAAPLAALEARERGCSQLPMRCLELLELATDGAPAASGAVAAALCARAEALPALLALVQLPATLVVDWEADAEEWACTALLPPLDDDDDGDDDGDDEDEDDDDGGGGGVAGMGDDDDDGGRAEGEEAEGLAGAASNVVGPAHRLQQAAERLLVALLWASPEAAPLLLRQLPASQCTPHEPLPMQLRRDACYAALGLCACQLQDHLRYSALLQACVREAAALGGADGGGGGGGSGGGAVAAPPARLRGLLQSRLCWLISCWWAFGASDSADENARDTATSLALLTRMLHAGADAAARLQAAEALRTLLGGADAETIALFRPAAAEALAGLAAAIGACEGDEACLRLLRLLRLLLTLLPGAMAEAPAQATPLRETLGALWDAAQRQQRRLLLRELRRVQRLVRG